MSTLHVRIDNDNIIALGIHPFNLACIVLDKHLTVRSGMVHGTFESHRFILDAFEERGTVLDRLDKESEQACLR